jgi:hypothetical protein
MAIGARVRPRILVGCIVRQHPETLKAHLETLQWQEVNADIEYLFIDDNDDPESTSLLESVPGARVERAAERGEAVYAVSEHTHEWNVPSFHRLGREKQRILGRAVEAGYDAVWLVDSDLLCSPDTLRSLLATGKEIVSAVFWTQWSPTDPPLPQVWQAHPYGFDGAGWTSTSFLSALESRSLVRVRGLGACTLIRSEALRRGAAFWPLLTDLPSEGMWQGEDRHFCVRAERAHIEMYADAWPRVEHVYRPSYRESIPAVMEGLRQEGREYVSITLEPCEEPGLAQHLEHVRGAAGRLPVLPDIAEAVASMKVGESRFVRVAFPASSPVEAYRNSTRTIRVTLVATA